MLALLVSNEKACPIMSPPPPLPGATGARKVALILALTLGLLVLVESALQVRSHLLFGQSIFKLLFGEPLYVRNAETGLVLLQPNRVVPGSRITLRSNSLGLRSPEIPLARKPGSWRLAVIGASTVMGLYDPDTDQTFPARLEQRLRREFPQRTVEVVNAGLVGFRLDDQRRMLETRVAALRPDLVIVYPGFNDFQGYCQEGKTGSRLPLRQGLPLLPLPHWLSTVDEIKKRTVFLRTTAVRKDSQKNPDDLDLRPYRARLEALVRRADELGLRLVLATNARAYRRDQPLAEQRLLSTSARYYNRCFDLDGLHTLYDRHNAEIRAVALARGIPLVPIDELVPGGQRYFADSQHFSLAGEVLVADLLAAFILSRGLLPK